MDKNSKFAAEQIKFVDELLEIYGIKGLSDYKSEVSQGDITDDMINKINNKMDDFKKYFQTKGFNLQRVNYKITNQSLALAFIKNCINYIGMNFDIVRSKNKTSVRLKPLNKMLYTYINTKTMSDIRHADMSDLGLNTGKDKYIHTLVKFEEEKEAWRSYATLSLSNVCCPVKKIRLLQGFPSNYTYYLFLNGHKVCPSKLVDGIQTFDFSDTIDTLRIFQDLTDVMQHVPTSNSGYLYCDVLDKYTVLNLSRIDNIYIDVIVLDPNDNFHIYNPVTKKFREDVYEVEIEGYRNDTMQPFTEKTKIYPNANLCLPVHHLVESIEILDDIDTVIQTEYGDIKPNGKIYKFDNIDFIKYAFSNMVDFKNLQSHHSHSMMNARIAASIPNTKYLNATTLNFSLLDNVRLINKGNDSQVDKIRFKVTYYNLKLTVKYENGDTQEALVFAS